MKSKLVSAQGGSLQKGVAILAITILLLLVATLGTLMVGRVGLFEQKMVGTDVRSKEVYSAAIGGLEYGVNWFLHYLIILFLLREAPLPITEPDANNKNPS